MEKRGAVVCVTGGSGVIGSCLVQQLLRRGYTVHATVKNINDEKETKHLEAMGGAAAAGCRLRLFQIDLLNYDSIVAAVHGASGVFHVASPCIVDQVNDPQRELLDPAIKGTINVLTAAKEAGVRRVVVTSSISAMIPNMSGLDDLAKDENCWTDEDYCIQNGLWYPLSKILAEKAAWKFAEEEGLDIVVINPGTVLGPIIPPTINASMMVLLRILQGCSELSAEYFMAFVHVKDVALAHIQLYESRSAAGRHLCVEALSSYGDFATKVAELYPEYKVPRPLKDTQPRMEKTKDASNELTAVDVESNPLERKTKDASKKLRDLGLVFIPLEQIVKDSVESLRSKGYLS